jgi:hypothetical protein
MGMMSFMIPGGLPADARVALQKATLIAGLDQTPFPCQVEVRDDRINLNREQQDSGHLSIPWLIDGSGHFITSTATLMERLNPYHLLIELARGKVNQIRNQSVEWQSIGLKLSETFLQLQRQATRALGQALIELPEGEAYRQAQISISLGYQAADELTDLYTSQVFSLRHERQLKLDSMLSCRLNQVPVDAEEQAFLRAFNTATLAPRWASVQPSSRQYDFEALDAVVAWASNKGIKLTAGPLIDLRFEGMPKWLSRWHGDPVAMMSWICNYVELVVRHFKGKISRWVICSGMNLTRLPGFGEDELLRLALRLNEIALAIDPDLELTLGLAQPWGEYMAEGQHSYSPFIFADTLCREGLTFSAFELEWFMGVTPRGSFCRGQLEFSRLLDLFGLLGVPLQLACSYPSSAETDPLADASQTVGLAGFHRSGLSTKGQAEWTAELVTLALAKPHVQGVTWDHFTDALPHANPMGGLVDREGKIKPALEVLANLRAEHLH